MGAWLLRRCAVAAILAAHLRADILKELRTLLRRGPRAERLRDREDVVVDRLREADDGELVALLLEEGREVGRGGVGVVAANRVEDLDAVADELVGRDALRVLALLAQAALHAVLDVGHLDARVADRRAAVEVERLRGRADARRDDDRLAEEEALVAVGVADDLDRRVLDGVL